jgi:hypothetical protein
VHEEVALSDVELVRLVDFALRNQSELGEGKGMEGHPVDRRGIGTPLAG